MRATVRRSRLTVLAAVVVSLAAVLAGCGGGDDDSSEDETTISLSKWKDEVNSLCTAAREKVEAVDEPAGSDDFATLASSGAAVKKIVNDLISDVEALGTPTSEQQQVDAFMDQWKSYTGDVDALVAAAKAEDEDQVTEAASALDEGATKKDELATDLGVDECAQQDPAGDEGDGPTDTLSKESTTTVEETDDETSSGNLSLEEWRAETDAACASLQQQYGDFSDAGDPSETAATIRSFASALVAEWDRIGPPAGDDTAAQELYGLIVDFETAATELQTALDTDDAAAAQAASDQIVTLADQIQTASTDLGLTNCAQ